MSEEHRGRSFLSATHVPDGQVQYGGVSQWLSDVLEMLLKKHEAAAHRRGWDQAIDTAAKATLSRIAALQEALDGRELSAVELTDRMAEDTVMCGLIRALSYPGPESK